MKLNIGVSKVTFGQEFVIKLKFSTGVPIKYLSKVVLLGCSPPIGT